MNTWLSLLPPTITIALAIATRQVYVSLFIGILSGAIILSGDFISGLTQGIDTIADVFSSSYATRNILFILMIGSVIKVMEHSGGIKGFVSAITNKSCLVKSKKGAQLAAYTAGLLMFMEGIGSMMIAGLVGRPLYDKFGVSREKLAYTANCTGSPVAWLFPLSGAGVFLMSIIGSQVDAGVIEGAPLNYLLDAIPYQFYSLILIISVPVFILRDVEFGKMSTMPARLAEPEIKDKSEGTDDKITVANMIIPLMLLISSIIGIILYTGQGDPSKGDTVSAIYWGVIMTLSGTGLYYWYKGIANMNTYVNWCIEGVQSMVPATIVLILAFALGNITNQLQTGVFVSHLIMDALPVWMIPAAIFITCCTISFSTGSSGAAISVMASLVIPLAATTGCSIPLALGAMVSGAVFGDQSSPISDSVIVAATAADCRSIDHFTTQIPYSIGAAGLSLVMFLAAGWAL
ncbi:sodium:proton antiporter [Photobacterium sagamiensis]|uniref:Na+/H+ antiporter NhaC family protein n=1 Tax=Photobacterium sagamiensis TaxID=2910241 RepID=UPI003D09FC85